MHIESRLLDARALSLGGCLHGQQSLGSQARPCNRLLLFVSSPCSCWCLWGRRTEVLWPRRQCPGWRQCSGCRQCFESGEGDFVAYSQKVATSDVSIEMVPVGGGTFLMGKYETRWDEYDIWNTDEERP